jgi:hypothetical protein
LIWFLRHARWMRLPRRCIAIISLTLFRAFILASHTRHAAKRLRTASILYNRLDYIISIAHRAMTLLSIFIELTSDDNLVRSWRWLYSRLMIPTLPMPGQPIITHAATARNARNATQYQLWPYHSLTVPVQICRLRYFHEPLNSTALMSETKYARFKLLGDDTMMIYR